MLNSTITKGSALNMTVDIEVNVFSFPVLLMPVHFCCTVYLLNLLLINIFTKAFIPSPQNSVLKTPVGKGAALNKTIDHGAGLNVTVDIEVRSRQLLCIIFPTKVENMSDNISKHRIAAGEGKFKTLNSSWTFFHLI